MKRRRAHGWLAAAILAAASTLAACVPARGATDTTAFEGIPGLPEELGAVTESERDRAAALLDAELARPGGAARAAEAAVRRALLRIAPLPGRDPARARRELAVVASDASAGTWRSAARYALAWIEETEGDAHAAGGAYQAIYVDDPDGSIAPKAGAGASRVLLRADDPSGAASWAQAVVERGGAPGIEDLREAAVREALRPTRSLAQRDPNPRSDGTSELRSVVAMARVGAGDLLAADRKRGIVAYLESGLRVTRRWPAESVTALAADVYGRAFAAVGETILLLEADAARVVGRTGAFGSIRALAADPAGRLWIADRRGDRIAVLVPGEAEPRVVHAARGARVVALAWDGRRVLALQQEARRVVALHLDGTEVVLADGIANAPDALSADRAGRFAVLDSRAGLVVLADSRGRVLDRVDLRRAGIARPTALTMGPDGSLDLFDERDGRFVRLP